jgi:hypothetical protein
MRKLLRVSGIVTATAFGSVMQGAGAEEIHFKQTCQSVGGDNSEQLGDREGHSISVGPFSCRMESGPMDGGVVTGDAMLEWDKTNAVLVMGFGVIRKPGGFVAYQDTEGKFALTVTDGKVTGFTGSGKIRWTIATGSAAPLAGKSFVYTLKSTGAGQWEADATAE